MPLNWNPILELAINEPEMKCKQGGNKPKAVAQSKGNFVDATELERG